MRTFNPADFSAQISVLTNKVMSCVKTASGRRRFPPELRVAVVHFCAVVSARGGSLSWVSEELGLSESLLWKWRRRFATSAPAAKDSPESFRHVEVDAEKPRQACVPGDSKSSNLRVVVTSGLSLNEALLLVRGLS